MSTIKDVASKAGVSIATVSRCLNDSGYVNEATKEHVIQTASSMNFVLRKKQRNQKRKTGAGVIAVLIPQLNPFFNIVINAIKQVAEQKYMKVIVCDSQERPEKEIVYLEMLKNIANGLIIVPTSQTADYNAAYLKELNDNSFPVVLLDRDISNAMLDGVFVDGFHGAYEGVKALINNGHKEIAIISGPTTSKPGLDRLNGYLEALRDSDLPINEEYILYGQFEEKKAYDLTKKLLCMRKSVTAIFCSNLVMAYGCLKAIDDCGLKIPDDISFITFDDDVFFNFSAYKISCIFNPGIQAGEEAAVSLINRIQNLKRSSSSATRRIILMPELVLRGSEAFPINRR